MKKIFNKIYSRLLNLFTHREGIGYFFGFNRAAAYQRIDIYEERTPMKKITVYYLFIALFGLWFVPICGAQVAVDLLKQNDSPVKIPSSKAKTKLILKSKIIQKHSSYPMQVEMQVEEKSNTLSAKNKLNFKMLENEPMKGRDKK